ncbi:MAG TPA: PEP-CTERM sorting domain-containing protein [Armatimonadota bacterium]|nr:PEP-CTERM sorting domain-containing protein [Armatimonadota bacterium]
MPRSRTRAGGTQIRASRASLVVIFGLALLLAGMGSSNAVEYQPVPGGAATGYVNVYDPNWGVEYGYARIAYWYWLDVGTGYWHYAYRVYNNDFYNTPADLSDDYHFGWLKPASPPNPYTPTILDYDTIHKFAVNLDPDNNGFGPPDLVILDKQAGSSAGGGPWGWSPDPSKKGADWTVSLGSGTPLSIAPTLHKYTKKDGWTFYTDGQTSRADGADAQYFEIASIWAPGLTTASISAGVDGVGAGLVMGPVAEVVIPEPSSLMALLMGSSLGGLAVLRRRRLPRSK